MRIGLIDVDSHNFPNLPLMKLAAWHKAQGDEVDWYYPLTSGRVDRVYMSKVFSFTPDYQYYINADEVIKGGSGYCIQTENGKEVYHGEFDSNLSDEIEHIYPDYSLYRGLDKDTAYGFLTRGCPRNCAFCHTTQKDGCRSKKVANLSEFWRGQKNVVLLDQNILACPDHLELLDQLIESGARIEFNGGLDIRLVDDENIKRIKRMKLKCIHFAFDRYQEKNIVMQKLRFFKDATGYNKDRGRIMVYVLCNFNTTLEQDIERIQFCRSLKFSPYPMIYDKEHADPVYRHLQRWCNNNIFWKVPTFEEYKRGAEERKRCEQMKRLRS